MLYEDLGIAKGVVKKVMTKDKAQPDRWGNTHTLMMILEDTKKPDGNDIIFTSSGKKPQVNAKYNGGWRQVQPGDEIKMKYKQNGDWYNFSGVEVIKAGEGSTQPQQQQQQKDFINPAEVGQAMNLAVSLKLVKSYSDFTEDKTAEAIALYKKTKQLFTDLWDKKPVDVTDYEDDVPF